MKPSDCGIFGVMLAVILSILGLAFVMPFSVEETDSGSAEVSVEESTLVIIENVTTRGGLEVFPEPDRSSGRIFAASASFAPHVAGINEGGDWLFVIYFDNGAMATGWSLLSQIVLTEEEINSLVVIDWQNPPTLPTELTGDLTSASRPYGTTNTGGDPIPTDTPEPSGGGSGGGGGNPPPTSPPSTPPSATNTPLPPPTNTPGPIVTQEPTEL